MPQAAARAGGGPGGGRRREAAATAFGQFSSSGRWYRWSRTRLRRGAGAQGAGRGAGGAGGRHGAAAGEAQGGEEESQPLPPPPERPQGQRQGAGPARRGCMGGPRAPSWCRIGYGVSRDTARAGLVPEFASAHEEDVGARPLWFFQACRSVVQY